MNNIEKIRESFKILPIELSLEKVFFAAEKTNPSSMTDEFRRKSETIIISCSDEIVNRIYQILSKVITNMEMELKQYLFHWIETPNADETEQSIEPLINFFHYQLNPYKEVLIVQNWQRFDIEIRN